MHNDREHTWEQTEQKKGNKDIGMRKPGNGMAARERNEYSGEAEESTSTAAIATSSVRYGQVQ
jgi:hypothetical protein